MSPVYCESIEALTLTIVSLAESTRYAELRFHSDTEHHARPLESSVFSQLDCSHPSRLQPQCPGLGPHSGQNKPRLRTRANCYASEVVKSMRDTQHLCNPPLRFYL